MAEQEMMSCSAVAVMIISLAYGQNSIANGGERNDVINGSHGATALGGKGDDIINFNPSGTAADSTAIYNLGDGSDKVTVTNAHGTLEFGDGISMEDVTVTYGEEGTNPLGQTVKITFANSDETINVDLNSLRGYDSSSLTLTFSDGSSIELNVSGDMNVNSAVVSEETF